ncbi:hypothetical protein F3Y22_tig00012936pilonHSYRG00013 [Hibiscus syriacus]|uniref:PPM-type phosphatase domain-containing protein n=1 Tax=Hibiscus syriacus TaxID=106335 RepID=A0A6A3C2C7_HIBSY|nr:hypothetical protein F3Y22_tig00012936pilonHSYRG00013 [Hibiscus syriacus]
MRYMTMSLRTTPCERTLLGLTTLREKVGDASPFLTLNRITSLWDVMSSQCAVMMVRMELMQHNDPRRCSRSLVKEALQRNTCDNLTVFVVCFSPDPPPKIEIPRSYKRRSISAEGLDLLKGVLNND